MAYGTRAMNAAILQVHKDLEEAAYVNGAPLWRTMRRVFFPLLLPTFAGVWIWVMLHVVRTAGTPLILFEGQQNQVLSILIWSMWDEGYMEPTAALGTLMILFLMLATLALRVFGFGRGSLLQEGRR
jgi:iron(III) transport system permease protein